MAIKTYSINEEIAEKFKEETPRQQTSNVLENLMREYIDETPDRNIQLDMTRTNLNDNQQRLLEEMIERNVNSVNKQYINRICREKNIYKDSKYVGQAIKAIVKDDNIPYKLLNGKVEPEDVRCSCDCATAFNVLLENDRKCLKCEAEIVEV